MRVANTTTDTQRNMETMPPWVGYLAAALSTVVFTLALEAVNPYLPLGRFPIVYILLVMAVAYFFDSGPALVAFFLSFFTFTYLFVPPYVGIWPLAVHRLGWAAIATLIIGAAIGGAAALALRRYQRHIIELADQLRRSEEKYRLLFENMNEMLAVEELVYDESGTPISWRYLDVNPAFEQATGVRPECIIGRRLEEVYAVTEPIRRQLQVYARVVATGNPERFELYFASLDKHFLLSVFSLGDRRFASIATDITDRTKAEEVLQRYRLLSENARDIILFVRPDGQVIEANDAAVEAYGYTHDELLALSVYDLRAPGTFGTIDEQMTAASNGGVLFETQHRRKDGCIFPVEVSSQGTTIGGERVLLSIIRDISERREAEEQLSLERRRMQAVLDALPVGVFIADANGRIVQTNEMVDHIWGGKAPPVVGVGEYGAYKGWWADTGEPIIAEDWALARAVTRGETSTGEVISIERFDGDQGIILNNAAPIHDQEGRIVGGVAAVEDITELIRLRQELEISLEEEKEESHRVAALESVAEAGIATLESQELLDTLAERMKTALGTHSCTILTLDEDRSEFVARAVHGEPLKPGVRFGTTEGFVGKISTERQTVYVENAKEDPLIQSAHIKQSSATSLLGTPLFIRDKVVGVAYVDTLQVHHFSDEDVRLFEAMAGRAASAIENARLHEQLMHSREQLEHQLTQLQQALVPTAPSVEDGYGVAAVYVPSIATGQEIGGDFYDVFKTRDGRYAILIGDVSGKGIPAASMAATARSTIHALAYESSCASDSLTRANAVLCSQGQAFGPFVTVFMAVLDLESGEICYASAGHPPAILCSEERVEFLKSGQPPVGLMCDQEYTEHMCRLKPGSKIITYTDGITEAKRDHELFELEGVLQTVTENRHLGARDMTERLLKAASDWAEGKLSDDVAVVVVERLNEQEQGAGGV